MSIIHTSQSSPLALGVSPATAPQAMCYAVKVRTASEETVTKALQQKSHRAMTPMQTVARRYSDRIKKVSLALFPGYVFVWMRQEDWLSVVSTNGVSYVVRTGHVLVPLTSEESRAIEILCRSKSGCEPCPMFIVGQKVMIEQGPFAGLAGALERVHDEATVVVSIESLHRAVRVTIGTNSIRILGRQSAA